MTSPYTQQRLSQYRGPQHSDDYNLRIEENYKDLIYLYNTLERLKSTLEKANVAYTKQILGLQQKIEDLEAQIEALEAGGNILSFHSATQIDTALFNSTIYAVSNVDRCNYNDDYNQMTLPIVATSSVSKLKFLNDQGKYSTPPSLELFVGQEETSSDKSTAIIETSSPHAAIVMRPGRLWERNVITNDSTPAECYLYIRIPNELSNTDLVNCLIMDMYPLNTVDVLDVSYTLSANPVLASASDWTTFNSDQIYQNVPEAAGHVVPGGWSGDEALDAGLLMFYFKPQAITGIRVTLRQRHSYIEGANTIFSYGMSKLDVRYDKFLETGSAIIRFDAPDDAVINSIASVSPQIWNVSAALVDDVFDYQILWETSYGSGTYTTSTVPGSLRVWIKVTLNKAPDGTTPSLSGLTVNFS